MQAADFAFRPDRTIVLPVMTKPYEAETFADLPAEIVSCDFSKNEPEAAIKFTEPDGSSYICAPMFFCKTASDIVERLQKPDVPDPATGQHMYVKGHFSNWDDFAEKVFQINDDTTNVYIDNDGGGSYCEDMRHIAHAFRQHLEVAGFKHVTLRWRCFNLCLVAPTAKSTIADCIAEGFFGPETELSITLIGHYRLDPADFRASVTNPIVSIKIKNLTSPDVAISNIPAGVMKSHDANCLKPWYYREHAGVRHLITEYWVDAPGPTASAKTSHYVSFCETSALMKKLAPGAMLYMVASEAKTLKIAANLDCYKRVLFEALRTCENVTHVLLTLTQLYNVESIDVDKIQRELEAEFGCQFLVDG